VAVFVNAMERWRLFMSRKKEYVLLVVLCGIFLAAGGYLFQIWEGYYEANAGYQRLHKFIIKEQDEGEEEAGNLDLGESEEAVTRIDYDGLQAINGDIVAWIQIPGIGVDYPVVQGEDNEHYLHYTFDGKANKAGSIFLDYRNRADFTDRKVILYGHNMKDGSMFSNLKKYQDADFRKEQGRVFLYLPNKVLNCEIVKCKQVPVQDPIYGVTQEENRELPEQIILSTCSTSSNMRFILECTVKAQ